MTGATIDQLLEQLTSEQRLVVEQLGRGPVKVTAAAGSGKTRTMASLYAQAVQLGIRVPRIMAVTFTERAASELKQRIAGNLLGLGTADAAGSDPLEGAWIGTFHQLVRRMLGERSYLAALPRDLRMLDEVAAGVLMQEVANAIRRAPAQQQGWLGLIPQDAPPNTILAVAEGAVAAVQRLRATPLGLAECQAHSRRAYTGFSAQGDPESELAWHQAALSLTVEIWEAYERRLWAERAVDFDGLLRTALTALKSSSPLRNWCQENFELVIVDEFQDTSPVQEALLSELVRPDRRSLFMVGDARQSIYGFRDAKPGIMREAEGRPFSLFRNYRSRESILLAADRVIRIDPQFAEDQVMAPGREDAAGHPVWLGLADNPFQEAEAIAEVLLLLRRTGIDHPGGEHQDLTWGDMAVLGPTFSRIGPPLEEAFRRRQIPYQTASGGLLERPEVKDVLAWLAAVSDQQQDLAWIRVLQSPACRIPDRALIQLAPSPGDRGLCLEDRLRRWLAQPDQSWQPEWVDGAGHCLQVVEAARRASSSRPASEVLSLLLEQSGLLRVHEALEKIGDVAGVRAMAALRELHRQAVELEADSSWLTVDDLLERLELLGQGPGRAEPPPRTDEPLVTISTVHRAKGLEWPVVVLADCRPFQNHGSAKVIWDRGAQAVICTRVGKDDSRAFARWKQGPDAQVAEEERRRLVYVAMTRARDLLLVTSSRSGIRPPLPEGSGLPELVQAVRDGAAHKGEYMALVEALAEGEPWIDRWPGFPDQVLLPWSDAPGPGRSPQPAPEDLGLARSEVAMLTERWERTRDLARQAASASGAAPDHLSYSGLEVIERCPRQFWFAKIAGFPEVGSSDDALVALAREGSGASGGRDQALSLGIAAHRILEQLHREHPDRAPTVAEAGAVLDSQRRQLDPGQQELVAGMLTRYLQTPVASWPTVAVEFSFTWSGWGGAELPPLVGSVDRIARDPQGRLVALDYKTTLVLDQAAWERYSNQLRLYVGAIEAGALSGREEASEARLILLRQATVQEVATGPAEQRRSVEWARSLARRAASGEYRSDLEFPDRPCSSCPYQRVCPERRGS